jgi:hypothetical protein
MPYISGTAYMRFCTLFVVVLLVTAVSIANAADTVVVVKAPVKVARRIFDPKNPPADMPPPQPPETAECDSDFLCTASVGGQAQLTDATHARLTITSVKESLELNIVIWLSTNSFKKLEDHENGHRKISEIYYKDADAVAKRVGQPYIGKQIDITGPDLHKAMAAELDKAGDEISSAYLKNTAVETTQLRYDAINQHGVNDVPVADAIAQALKETYPKPPATEPAKP